jgi:DNA primase
VDLATLIESGALGEWSKVGGDEYKICCPHPRHDDRTPSCAINVSKHVFICWSCPEGARGHVGQIFRWLHLNPDEVDLKSVRREKTIPRVHYIDDVVLSAWVYEPTEWLDAGFSVDTLTQHEIGYDAHNKRITIPVRDRHGRLIAVSGRATEEWQMSRYKFYGSKELLDYAPAHYSAAKGNVLWRQHLLGDDIDSVVVVEGFKAAMWLVQHGVHSTVAVMGKDVTDAQVSLLSALRVPVILMFDGDPPGRKGADTVGIKLYRGGVSVSYASLPEGLSPDDLNCGQITTALDEAQPHLRRRKDYGQMVTKREILPAPESRKRHGRRRGLPLQQRIPSGD